MTESTYSVTGMTCDHCVRAVQAAVTGIAGVVSVTVDLGAGRVTLTSDGPVDPDRVKAAVEEAGYEVTG
jgi:copper ion binding protein